VTVNPSVLNISETGGTAVFTMILDSAPSSSVTLGVSSADAGEGMVSNTSMKFAPAVWNIEQTLTVTGVDDFSVDGDISFAITTAAIVSGDTNFHGQAVPDVVITNTDG
jgi:hypothetical protein